MWKGVPIPDESAQGFRAADEREGDNRDEADTVLEQALRAHSVREVCDIAIVPALRLLEADFARSGHLLAQRGTSQEELAFVAGDRAEALGSVKVARAQRAASLRAATLHATARGWNASSCPLVTPRPCGG